MGVSQALPGAFCFWVAGLILWVFGELRLTSCLLYFKDVQGCCLVLLVPNHMNGVVLVWV